jgi:hypothetical protein
MCFRSLSQSLSLGWAEFVSILESESKQHPICCRAAGIYACRLAGTRGSDNRLVRCRLADAKKHSILYVAGLPAFMLAGSPARVGLIIGLPDAGLPLIRLHSLRCALRLGKKNTSHNMLSI